MAPSVLAFLLLSAAALSNVALAEEVLGNTNICAAPDSEHGDRAVECGATEATRPAFCCAGFACKGRASVKCVADSGVSAGVEDAEKEADPGVSAGVEGGEKEPEEEGKDEKAGLLDFPIDTECSGYRERSVGCGDEDLDRPPRCCEGYACTKEEGKTHCVNEDENTKPFDPIDPVFQKRPIAVNSKITVVGTTFENESSFNAVKIGIPNNAKPGDLLLMLVGGSSGGKRPSEPSGNGWTKITEHGRADLLLMAFYKWYGNNDGDSYTIGDGRNTIVILTAIKGVDKKDPIVQALAARETYGGKDGRAVAPSAFGVNTGAVVAAFLYDDPQVAQVLNKGFEVLTSSSTLKQDGMAAFVSSTDATGSTGLIKAVGSPQSGGGNDVTMTLTFRPDGGPYDKPGDAAVTDVAGSTDKPTGAPTRLRPQTSPPTTMTPTDAPTSSPTPDPSSEPTLAPTEEPTEKPSNPPVEPPFQVDLASISSAARRGVMSAAALVGILGAFFIF